MQTKTERHQPLSVIEARSAEPVSFSVEPDSPEEFGKVALVVSIPSRLARVRIEQFPTPDTFETTARWLEGGREVDFVDDAAEEALSSLIDAAGAEHAKIVHGEATYDAVLNALQEGRRGSVVASPASEREHVILAAFTVEAATRAQAHAAVLQGMPHPGGAITSWWVAEDDRTDGSDLDAAVFVSPGKQQAAHFLLERAGLTASHNEPVGEVDDELKAKLVQMVRDAEVALLRSEGDDEDYHHGYANALLEVLGRMP